MDCNTDKIVTAPQQTPNGSSKPLDDMSDVKPGILEMIQEEQRVSNQANSYLIPENMIN